MIGMYSCAFEINWCYDSGLLIIIYYKSCGHKVHLSADDISVVTVVVFARSQWRNM